ncbi:type IX secretion system membrane protein PorP/SprF, partial [Flavobacterium circumlabens]
SFGLTAGAMLYNENLTQLGLENDPEFQEDINSFTPTVGLGFLYNTESLYTGVSAPNVLNSAFNSKNNTNLKNVYYGYFGYRFFTGGMEDIVINPSFLAKYMEGAAFQADLNVLVNYKNKVEFGGGYRTSDTVNLLAGFY